MSSDSNGQNNQKVKLILPSDKTLQDATKLSLRSSKPICFYFYIDSLKQKCSIVSDGEDRVLFKNSDEHTSPIINTYLSDNCYIIITENTIYIVNKDICIK